MPTLKQEMAVKRLLENAGNISKSMSEAGYAPATAKNPLELTRSKGFRELFEKYVPDKLLGEKHRELLTIPKIKKSIRRGETIEQSEELDVQAIKSGLDMAYKVKGHYAAEKHDLGGEGFETLRNLFSLAAVSDEE